MVIGRPKNQKNPRVRKIRVRNSGAGNGCANFMDTWKKCVLSAGKPMSIKFRVLGGGFGGGGGSADFIFMGARIFLKEFSLCGSSSLNSWALRANSWICCLQLPCHPCKSGTLSISSCNTREHTPSIRRPR